MMTQKIKKEKKIELFDLLAGITKNKKPFSEYTEAEFKEFNVYMINRWLSMDHTLIELINELQLYTIGVLKPRDVYKMYLDFLPRKKLYVKYLTKKSTEKYPKELIHYLKLYFEIGSSEILMYLTILPKDDVRQILSKYGLDDKQIKKLMKYG